MQRHRSLFFPLALIAAGSLWLLVQMNIIPAENLWALTHIWPFLLIALGVGLILRSFWDSAGMIVSLLVVAGAVLAVVYAPRLGWADPTDLNLGDNFSGSVAGSGSIATESRKVNQFDSITINYPAMVVITQGTTESVKVEADDNLLPQLDTEVREGKLIIQNNERDWSKRVRASKMIKITIVVKDLKDVEFSTAGTLRVEKLQGDSLNFDLSGAGEVELIDVKVNRLDTNLSGAGNIKASGSADQVKIEIDGFGSFNGDKLQSNSADVTISGAGSVKLKVKSELSADINGAGSIEYYGTPKVIQNISGAGSVRQIGN